MAARRGGEPHCLQARSGILEEHRGELAHQGVGETFGEVQAEDPPPAAGGLGREAALISGMLHRQTADRGSRDQRISRSAHQLVSESAEPLAKPSALRSSPSPPQGERAGVRGCKSLWLRNKAPLTLSLSPLRGARGPER